jgi:hypothetical protein
MKRMRREVYETGENKCWIKKGSKKRTPKLSTVYNSSSTEWEIFKFYDFSFGM